MFVQPKGLLWLYFFQSVLVLGPPCFVESRPKGQALFLRVFECVVYVYVYIHIAVSVYLSCWLHYSFDWCYLYRTFCVWGHPGILNPPLEFLSYSHNFCFVLVEKQLLLLCNLTLEPTRPGSHFIHYSVLTSSFLSHETKSVCQKNTTF